MSRIFDAFQKAEADKGRSGGSQAGEVLELLRGAEGRIASAWEGRKEELVEQCSEAVGARSIVRSPAERFEAIASVEDAPVKSSRLVALLEPQSPAAEAFRVLAVRLRQLQRDVTLKSVLISSAIPQEGKSLVAGNLACTLAARSREKVLLLEGDSRRPTLSRLFGLNGKTGLNEYFREGKDLTECIYYLERAAVWFLPAGQPADDSVSLLQFPGVQPLMRQLHDWFDWIIVDSPPMLPLADASVWMRMADGILLVVRQGVTEKRELQKAIETIDGHKLLGAVLNCAKSSPHSDYYYGSPAAAAAAMPPKGCDDESQGVGG